MREMEALYIGTDENPLINDEVLARSRRLKAVEFEHCGDTEATYIVAHDVSYADGRKNAECADVVLKLTPFTNRDKRINSASKRYSWTVTRRLRRHICKQRN